MDIRFSPPILNVCTLIYLMKKKFYYFKTTFIFKIKLNKNKLSKMIIISAVSVSNIPA